MGKKKEFASPKKANVGEGKEEISREGEASGKCESTHCAQGSLRLRPSWSMRERPGCVADFQRGSP